jgi:hypothetical protein
LNLDLALPHWEFYNATCQARRADLLALSWP